jgi:hypothetical protein
MYYLLYTTVELSGRKLAHTYIHEARVCGARARDFVNFRGENYVLYGARVWRTCAGLTGPRPDLTMAGRCSLSFSAGSSKIKIWTSSPYGGHKAQ